MQKEIFISDLQRLKAPDGWYETIIETRMKEGYELTRDWDKLGWVLKKKEDAKR